ncbi:DUF3108 domain-containing protein [uncultured Piscinibacter sp.]|uniref:DUF3108 domain-containing protein n=1 Tax=uncultured Piscinibacter sp. TaxID=1131835 RepID=UPI00260DBBDF|nr:DUF3108 domain-containing protein [uncultured Piscinibacter sp.]
MLSAGGDPRRRRAFAALTLLALGLHALLLGGLDLGQPTRPASPVSAALQVRTLSAVVAEAPEPEAPPPAPAAAPRPRRRAPAAAEPVPPVAVAVDAPQQATEPVLNPEPLQSTNPSSMPLPSEVEQPAAGATAPAASSAAAASAAAPAAALASAPAAVEPAASEGARLPLYATRLPPPATLRYELRRGRLTGGGELLWRTDAGRYQLRLEGSVLGLNVLTQVSEGALDETGLAPLRFTDQRARRAAVAANFEREAGRIRFSGPKTELPWQPGVQDRLSWMIQLAAVAAAEPRRLAAGEHIVLQVIGARGDASLWSFRSLGPETLTLFSEPVATMRLLREPRSDHDTRVEVWLDPARHHLPVRATMGNSDEDRLELRLRELLP